jgi:hypothetical protein
MEYAKYSKYLGVRNIQSKSSYSSAVTMTGPKSCSKAKRTVPSTSSVVTLSLLGGTLLRLDYIKLHYMYKYMALRR